MKQHEAIEIIMKGYNVFLTGAAGSGKTWVINECVSKLKETGKNIAVTATTGIAATHINGVTLHSWARIKIYKEKELFEKGDKEESVIEHIIKRDNIAVENIFGCHILIIDEVSMLNAYLLTAVDMICRGIKKKPEIPFGGIQVILSGDFFQLPPIPDPGRPMKYAFESDSWRQNDFKICYLEEQYRQFDTKFITILNELRNNSLSATSLEALRSRLHASIDSTIKPIQLYPKNDAVDRINLEELGKIKEPVYRYKMSASGDKDLINTLKKQCLAKEKLELKVGAPVLFIRNSTNKNYVNGTQGTVVGFKSLDSRFVKGVTYFEDDDYNDGEYEDDEDDETYENNLYPVVETCGGRVIDATPEIWSFSKIIHYKEAGSDGIVRTQIKEEMLASIAQVPLILGWSISINKSQGMSLDYAKMDLSQSFLKGMGYVAISRVRSLEGIILLGYNALALMVNPQIIAVDKVLREESENNRLALCSTIKEEFCESEEVEESLEEEDAFDNYKAEVLTATKEFFRKSVGGLLIRDSLEIEVLVDKLILDITQSKCAVQILERNFTPPDKKRLAM